MTFVASSQGNYKNVSYSLVLYTNYVCFSLSSKLDIAAIEYPQKTFLPVFTDEDFLGLFAHPSIFFNQRFKINIKNV